MRRRGSGSIAANPVLIGAATTLVAIVAVFLAYNANGGLPFVPTYQLKAQVPSAAQLVKGNEVRIGGARVGLIKSIRPVTARDGRVFALLDLRLETTIKPLPVDSTLLVRPRSSLGLKYLEITKGTSTQGYLDGATIPLKRSVTEPIEIDEVFNTFDAATRRASQVDLKEFSDALAGRGQSLNLTIGELPSLLSRLEPVARNLADPRTGLGRFFRALDDAAAAVAPVAQTQADLFANLDKTFTAFADVARPYIQESISGGPPALDAAIKNLPLQRPFLANSTALFKDLRPGIRQLRLGAGDLADAFVLGTTAARRAPAFNARLASALDALKAFSEDARVPIGLTDLKGTVSALAPTIDFATPTQTVCNYVNLLFRNVNSLLSDGDGVGTWQRFGIIAPPVGPNNEGGPASAPANGPSIENHLHSNPYPNTAAPGQPRECEAGNEPYVVGQTTIGNPGGPLKVTTEDQLPLTTPTGGTG